MSATHRLASLALTAGRQRPAQLRCMRLQQMWRPGRPRPPQPPHEGYSLFMLLGNDKLPTFAGIGHVNFYMCQVGAA